MGLDEPKGIECVPVAANGGPRCPFCHHGGNHERRRCPSCLRLVTARAVARDRSASLKRYFDDERPLEPFDVDRDEPEDPEPDAGGPRCPFCYAPGNFVGIRCDTCERFVTRKAVDRDEAQRPDPPEPDSRGPYR